jgi:GT2 family glycosyltransferase
MLSETSGSVLLNMANPETPYAIVIPAVDNSPKCRELLETLLTSISEGYYDCHVVVCWDDASDETIQFFEDKYKWITSLPHKGRRLNFAKNSNRGLRYVYEELHLGAFLINMDVCLPHKSHLEKIINNGISSPRAIHIDGMVHAKIYALNQKADPSCPCNKTVSKPAEPVRKFAAFCMWVSKYAFSKIGYLDEHTFIASFEDDDFCARACLADLPCEQFEIPVHHELKNRELQISTTGSYDMPQLMDHLWKFMKKWGIPMYIPHADFADWILQNKVWEDKWKIQ